MPNPLVLSFHIEAPQELAAGLRGFTDQVTVTIASGNPGGEPGEFEQALVQFLSEWFDAGVEPLAQALARFAQIDASMAALVDGDAIKDALILNLFAQGPPVYAVDEVGEWVRIVAAKKSEGRIYARHNENCPWFAVVDWETRP